MSKSYSSVHEHMHEQYIEGKTSKMYKSLDYFSRSMLNKATIVKNIKKAKILYKVVNEKIKSSGTMENDDIHQLYMLLTDCFEVIVDDVILLSAFEMLMKRKLLAKSYIIHEITEPLFLKKKQKKVPIHVRTIQSNAKNKESIKFSDNTIGIGFLMKNDYLSKTKVPDSILKGLAKVRNRRNLVHFQSPFAWSVDNELLELVQYLDKEIPSIKIKGVRRT
ncbi:MAG: hypothetical protein COA86_02325 [Kangiella sp.]|nr:MAG: hypothetical protein COA86_02325 [Kangiella sp.]